MQITGTIVKVLPVQTGTSAKGEWRKANYVLEYGDKIKKNMSFSVFGSDQDVLQEGYSVNIDFDVESREYQGKWYTDAKAWKINVLERGGKAKKQEQTQIPNVPLPAEDGLPF